jgi:replication factor C small subunit
MSESNTLWVEKYRPSSLNGYIASEHLVNKLSQYIRDQDIPHLLFSGRAGGGKTTAAKILVNSIDCDYQFINASDENSVDVMRNKIKSFASTKSFKPLKIIVLDEADYITPSGQAALRNIMEVCSADTRFILTCNYIEKISAPILSRSQHFVLTPPSKRQVAVILKNILDNESVKYKVDSIATIVNSHFPDIRQCIHSAQNQTIDGVLSINVDELVRHDYKLEILDILLDDARTAEKKLGDIRQIVINRDMRDFNPIYRMLFDRVTDYMPDKVPQVISAIAEGQYRDCFVPDKEINFVATLYNILL